MSGLTLEVGQKIYWERGGINPGSGIRKVERLTKTQAILTDGVRFNRETGRVVGESGGVNRATYRNATDADVDRLLRKRTVRKIQKMAEGLTWESASHDDLTVFLTSMQETFGATE